MCIPLMHKKVKPIIFYTNVLSIQIVACLTLLHSFQILMSSYEISVNRFLMSPNAFSFFPLSSFQNRLVPLLQLKQLQHLMILRFFRCPSCSEGGAIITSICSTFDWSQSARKNEGLALAGTHPNQARITDFIEVLTDIEKQNKKIRIIFQQ